MAEVKNEMTVEEAMRIVMQMSPDSTDFEKASSFLKANCPGLWAAYVKYGSDLMASKEDKQPKKDAVAPEVLASNYQEIERLAAQYSFEEFKAQEEHQKLLANVEVLNDTDDTKPASVVNADRQNDYMSLLFAAAQMKAHVSLLGDKSFAEENDKAGIYKDRVDSIFYTDLARVGVASAITAPNEKESKIDTKSFKNWVIRNSKKARDVLGHLIEGKKKVTVRTSAVATSLGASQAQTGIFVDKMQARADKSKGEAKGYLQTITDGFKLNLSKIDEAIKNAKDKPFEEKVQMARNFFKEAWANNKYKIATGAAVAVAFPMFFAAYPVAVAGALGGYIAAGSWVWPVHTERMKIQNDARREGKPVPSNAEARRLAWKNVTSKDRLGSYLTQGAVSTVLGGVAAAALPLVAGMGATGVVAGLTAGKMARIGAPAVGQLVDASLTSLTRPYDPVAQANAQVTALSGMSSLILGGITTGLVDMDTNAVSSTAETPLVPQVDTAKAAMPGDTLASASAGGYVPGSSEQEFNKIVNLVTGSPEETPHMLDFPDQYSPKTGLTQKQFNTLVRTSPGVFGPLAREAGMTDAQYMDLIYTNIHQHMDKFPGLTEEQVLYDANRMIAFHAKATNIGGGFLDNIDTGADHLNNEFSKMSFFKNNWSEDKIAAFAEDMQDYTYSSKQEVLSELEKSYSDIPLATRQAVCNALVGNRVAYVNGPQIEALQAMIMGCHPDERYIQGAADLVRQHVNSNYDYLRPENGTGNRYIGGYGTDADCGKGIGHHRWATGDKVVTHEPKASIDPLKPALRRMPIAPVDTLVTPVDTLSTPVDTLSTPVDTLSTPVDTLSTKVDTLSTKVDTLSTPPVVQDTTTQNVTTHTRTYKVRIGQYVNNAKGDEAIHTNDGKSMPLGSAGKNTFGVNNGGRNS